MKKERSKILGYVRLVLVYIFIIILILLSKPTPPFFYIGLVFVIIGEAFRFWAAGHLIKSKELITSGPYRHTQHPLYLGRFLILTGFCIMAVFDYFLNLFVLAAGYLIFFLYYFRRKLRVEGSRLKEIHGDKWVEYSSHVPPFFPRIKGYGEPGGVWSSQKMFTNREYFMVIGIIVIALILLFKAYHNQP